MQISKGMLDRAKAYLCWDRFPDLSIQLVAQGKAVSYYHPPSEQGMAILFYPDGDDCTNALFLLFHEAAHHQQYLNLRKTGRESLFWESLQKPTGTVKVAFENEAWRLGRCIFQDFLQLEKMDNALLAQFDRFARQSIETYQSDMTDQK